MQSPVSHELGRKLVSQAVSELKSQGVNGTTAAGFVFDCIRHPIKCATKAFNSRVGKATITYINNIANDLAAQRTMDVLHGRSTIRQALTTLPTARETLGLLIRNFPRVEAKQIPRRMRTSFQLDLKRHRKLAGSHPPDYRSSIDPINNLGWLNAPALLGLPFIPHMLKTYSKIE